MRKTQGGEACFLRSRVGFPPTLPGAGAGHYSILQRDPTAVPEFNSAQTTHGKVMYALEAGNYFFSPSPLCRNSMWKTSVFLSEDAYEACIRYGDDTKVTLVHWQTNTVWTV